MTLTPVSIAAIGPSEYLVQFRSRDGSEVVVTCDVHMSRDVMVVLPRPDVFMTGDADGRATSAAVIALHQARVQADS